MDNEKENIETPCWIVNLDEFVKKTGGANA
jgi:hypothetical protein